jgi:deoxyadenosine/deoxycytidine kinase
MELSTPVAYWDRLKEYYEEWIDDLNIAPILRIDAAQHDIVENPENLDLIITKIGNKFRKIKEIKERT